MEYDTGHHLGHMFLTGAQRIDHSTFSKFLSKFKTEVVALFSQIVLVCVEQGLLDFKVLCVVYRQCKTTGQCIAQAAEEQERS